MTKTTLRIVQSVDNTKQAKRAQKNLGSYWSAETQLSQTVLIRCMELLERIDRNTGKRSRKVRRSDWQSFLSIQMKTGLSIKQAADLWRQRKLAKSA